MVVKEKRKYKCHWCKFEFEQEVGKGYAGRQESNNFKASSVSTQVVCPKCKNGLKTWEV